MISDICESLLKLGRMRSWRDCDEESNGRWGGFEEGSKGCTGYVSSARDTYRDDYKNPAVIRFGFAAIGGRLMHTTDMDACSV